jgi:Anti-sigma-K factor rskA
MTPKIEELACLYVVDRLDARERSAVEARLPHDPELAALVAELESVLARQVHSLPRNEPPAGLLARIESEIDRTSSGKAPPPATAPTPLWATVARWGIAAVIAASLGTIALVSLRRASLGSRPFMIIVGLDSRQSTLAELPIQQAPLTADARFIQLASMAQRYWEKPDELPVKMEPGRGRGYAVFDPASNQGFIAIRQLPAIEQGMRYHLWILDTASGRIREAGVLPATESTQGLFFFNVAPAKGVRPESLNFFVTAEDAAAADSSRPRGKVVLGDRRI